MKRNAAIDNEDELISSHKKLKFGVDTILGNISSHSEHKPIDALRQQVHIESTTSSIYASKHLLLHPLYPLYGKSPHNAQQTDLLRQMAPADHPLWQSNFRSVMEMNESIAENGFYAPVPMSPFFWPMDLQNRVQPRMLRRAVFSNQQRIDLETTFSKQKYISKPARKKLAQRLDLRDSQVKIWFQNRRMKWRNNKERELFTSKNSINNNYSDYQVKEETYTYCPSILDHQNEENHSHTNTQSIRE